MTSSPSAAPDLIREADRPFLAIGFVLSAMVIFSVMDGIAKFLTGGFPAIQVVWGRYFFNGLFLIPWLLVMWRERPMVTGQPRLQLVRGLFMLGSSAFFVTGLSHLPLAQATAIGFVAPLLVTALSIPLLGEKVGLRRWMAVCVGFVGMLIIIRPGTDQFDPAAIFPVLSATSWALGLIMTRRMRHAERPVTTLFYTALVGLLLISIAVPFVWVETTPQYWVLMAVMGLLSVTGQYLLIRGFNIASASLLAPFSYSNLIWTTIIGYVLFRSIPDFWTWIGAGIVIASGIYVWHRERVNARPVVVPGASISPTATRRRWPFRQN
ncbi:MAG: DMT family transporter [Alphaproteobacteria bacterium]|nr:DMT family transporter [Alphaproteobacteria bacterium]MBU0797475.1 DMT family transporter [Alphaproteobacteria bacterium]MBU0889216.1 DMT family transporter [Alphaproteobacteria bacterium]MBU1813805.1 DMT family transporter [Alphaproteobacteria bacterium]MBU2091100.1 DMT family transporter [Alphaproteobacteria bacterium]